MNNRHMGHGIADLNRIMNLKSKRDHVEEIAPGVVESVAERSGMRSSRISIRIAEVSARDYANAWRRIFPQGHDESSDAQIRSIISFAQDRLEELGLPRVIELHSDEIYFWGEDGSWRSGPDFSRVPPRTVYRSSTLENYLAKHLGLGALDYPVLCVQIVWYGQQILDQSLPRILLIRYSRRFERRLTQLEKVLLDAEQNSKSVSGRKGATIWSRRLAEKLLGENSDKNATELWKSISVEYSNMERDYIDLDERYFVCRRIEGGAEVIVCENEEGDKLSQSIRFPTWQKAVAYARKKM